MKKIIIILTILAMAVSLFAGCGSGDDKDVGGNISKLPEESSSPVQEDEAEFDTGYVIGGTYSNEFLGINLTLDDNWVFFSDEQIAELNGATADLIGDEDIKEMLETSGVIYDLYATTLDTECTISIAIENLGLLYGAVLSEEAYVDAAIGNLGLALESAGMLNVVCEKSSVEFCGKEHAAIDVSAVNLYGIELYETIVCYKVGSYMACVTVVATDKETSLGLLDLFYTGEPVYNNAPVEPAEPALTDIFNIGETSDSRYVNRFFGFEANFDSDWNIYTPADLAAYNGISSDVFTTKEALDIMAVGQSPYIMSAVTSDELCYAEFIVEDLTDTYADLFIEDYIDITLPQVKESYAGILDNLVCEVDYVEFCGQLLPAIVVSGNNGDLDLYQYMICLKSGRYIGLVNIISFYDNACDAIASCFSPIG